jgi:putative addiction module component (TIGR02574 family)
MTKKQLVDSVLHLPAGQRARLARDLIASLEGPPDPDAPKAWTKEVDRRAKEVREGAVQLAGWKQVRKRIASRLRSRK